MTRLFFILASVVTAVAVFFSFQNRSSLIEARAAKDEHNSKIKKELGELETVIGDVVTKQTDRKRIEGERDEQRELLESAKRKLASKKSKAESLDAQLKKYQDEFAAYRDQVDQLPDGVSLETLSDDINRLKEKQTEKKDDLALLEKEIMVMEDNHERVTKTKEEKIAYQEARTKSFDVNSLEANVTRREPRLGIRHRQRRIRGGNHKQQFSPCGTEQSTDRKTPHHLPRTSKPNR